MPIPKILHFTTPPQLSESDIPAIERARRLHPTWKICIWRDPIAPEGFKLSKYWKKTRSGPQLADLIRLEVIEKYGGIYLDTDFELNKSLDSLAETFDAFIASENGTLLTNAAFGATAGNPAITALVNELLSHEPDWAIPPNITTGPYLFTQVLKWRKDITILPRETFYPYGWDERPRTAHEHTYATHTWAGSWLTLRRRLHNSIRGRSCLSISIKRNTLTQGLRRRLLSNERLIHVLHHQTRTYPRAETLLAKTIHGHSIVLDGRDLSVTPEIAQRGYYELREELLVRNNVHGGDYFIDVGANVGTFALLAARCVGPFGRVYAYEPNPSAANLLRASATKNWVHERLLINECAVGAHEGTATLKVSASHLGGATVSTTATSATFNETSSYLHDEIAIPTNIVTLDNEFSCDLPIRFLKIDAEGFEADVMQGAARLISHHCIDIIMLEAIREVAGDSWERTLSIMEKTVNLGYGVFRIGRNGTLARISLSNVRYQSNLGGRNVVLVSNSAMQRGTIVS